MKIANYQNLNALKECKFFFFFFNGENRIKVCSSVDGNTSVSSFAIMLELSEMSPLEGAG